MGDMDDYQFILLATLASRKGKMSKKKQEKFKTGNYNVGLVT